MNEPTDSQLLRDYAGQKSETAFAELLQRHIDFVYSAARRMVRDPHLAEDVTQGVFIALARNSTQLRNRSVLSGWLHRTAQNIAAHTVRTLERQRAREQEAAAMNDLLSTDPDATWAQVSPHLDAALGELSDSDREALLLRYFERKSARQMGHVLGISDEAAQRRVSRAVERLRELFAKRGVTIGVGGLATLMSANAVQAAPVGLAATISTTATALHGSTLGATTAANIPKAITMTLTKKTIIAAAVLIVCGAATVVVNNPTQAPIPSDNSIAVNLDDYVGRFEMPGRRIDIQRQDTGISVFIDGKPAFVAYPQSVEKFVSRDHNSITELTFVRDGAGRVAHFRLVRDGRRLGELKRPETL